MRSRGRLAVEVLIWACALACGLAAARARAGDLGNHLYDRFQLRVSGAMLWLGSQVRIDARDGSLGTELDVEDALGLPRTTLAPRAELRWRPGRRHELGVGYQFARRSGPKTLEATIAVGDTSFVAGARVNSVLDSDNLFLTYRYAVMARPNTQVAVCLGFGAFFFNVGVDALISGPAAGKVDSVTYNSTASFVGPTGALGLFGLFSFGSRWYLAPDTRYLRIGVDNLTAEVVEGGMVAAYYLSRKVGIEGGLGIRGVRVGVNAKPSGGIVKSDVSARVKFTETQLRLGVVLAL